MEVLKIGDWLSSDVRQFEFIGSYTVMRIQDGVIFDINEKIKVYGTSLLHGEKALFFSEIIGFDSDMIHVNLHDFKSGYYTFPNYAEINDIFI